MKKIVPILPLEQVAEMLGSDDNTVFERALADLPDTLRSARMHGNLAQVISMIAVANQPK